jgi:hypothetical protein
MVFIAVGSVIIEVVPMSTRIWPLAERMMLEGDTWGSDPGVAACMVVTHWAVAGGGGSCGSCGG